MWTMQRTELSRCAGVSMLSRSCPCIGENGLRWLHWAHQLYYSTWRLWCTHKQDGALTSLSLAEGQRWPHLSPSLRSSRKRIHSGSCLSVDNSLALRVYGLGKHKAIACLCLPWHQDSISNRAQTLKRLQKCIESIQKLFIVFVCKIAFYLHDHVVPCHEPSQWYVTIRTKKGTYFDVNHYSTFEIENALCFHKVLVA